MSHGGFAMWAVMMVAMMAPAEAPAAVAIARARGLRKAVLFAAVALAPWLAFSYGAARLQDALHGAGLIDHHSGAFASPLACAAFLAAAGALQFAPWKRACAQRCRQAAQAATFSAALRAGALSVASCGVLMLAPLAVGMGLWPMALLAALMVAERIAPEKWRVSPLSGAVIVAAAVAVL